MGEAGGSATVRSAFGDRNIVIGLEAFGMRTRSGAPVSRGTPGQGPWVRMISRRTGNVTGFMFFDSWVLPLRGSHPARASSSPKGDIKGRVDISATNQLMGAVARASESTN